MRQPQPPESWAELAVLATVELPPADAPPATSALVPPALAAVLVVDNAVLPDELPPLDVATLPVVPPVALSPPVELATLVLPPIALVPPALLDAPPVALVPPVLPDVPPAALVPPAVELIALVLDAPPALPDVPPAA